MADYGEIEDPFGDELNLLIRKVIKIWVRISQKSLEEFGLTPSQMQMMGAIIHLWLEKTESTQIILSQESNIDPMTTSTILRNLQKKGLITRKESETDTRARVVELTDEGLKLFKKAMAKIKLLYDKMVIEEINKEELKMKLNVLYDKLNKLNEQL